MKLELKQLAPYLPYGIRYQFETMTGYHISNPLDITDRDAWQTLKDLSRIKPILRPLSDYSNRRWMSDADFNNYIKLKNSHLSTFSHLELNEFDNFIICFSDHQTSFSINHGIIPIYDLLLKYHFDVFGLIEKGLAIDINTLES